MGVKLLSASNGSVELVAPSTASNYTATMPAKTGTVMLDGPAFSAYSTSNQSIATGTYTKVAFQAEEFDTDNCFDSTTNYRFTPTVAGYYRVTLQLAISVDATPRTVLAAIYKNGVLFKYGYTITSTVSSNYMTACNVLISMNGTTDYLEAYGYQNSGATRSIIANVDYGYFQAELARGE